MQNDNIIKYTLHIIDEKNKRRKIMNIDQALLNIYETATPENKSVDMVVHYSTPRETECSASLTTKGYFENKTNELFTLRRAWGYACMSDPEKVNAVTYIEVIPTVNIDTPKKATRLTA